MKKNLFIVVLQLFRCYKSALHLFANCAIAHGVILQRRRVATRIESCLSRHKTTTLIARSSSFIYYFFARLSDIICGRLYLWRDSPSQWSVALLPNPTSYSDHVLKKFSVAAVRLWITCNEARRNWLILCKSLLRTLWNSPPPVCGISEFMSASDEESSHSDFKNYYFDWSNACWLGNQLARNLWNA